MSRTPTPARPKPAPRYAALAAVLAGFAATGVSADTLAQPKDSSLERAAANYIRYREDVAAVEALPFNSADITREAHRRLGAHDPTALSGGWVAYAALVAADTPEFADALKKELRNDRKRAKFMAEIASDPSYPRKLNGADKAIEKVLAMTMSDSARIVALGETFKSQAYAMQKTKWGKQRISSSQERIKEVSNYQSNRGAPPEPGFKPASKDGVVEPSLASASGQWGADWGATAPAAHMSEKNAQVIIDRVLNLAARYSAGSLNEKTVAVYAKNNKSDRCLSMAKLTLDQCIAATRTPYEEAFCLGEHALNDVASCVSWVGDDGAS